MPKEYAKLLRLGFENSSDTKTSTAEQVVLWRMDHHTVVRPRSSNLIRGRNAPNIRHGSHHHLSHQKCWMPFNQEYVMKFECFLMSKPGNTTTPTKSQFGMSTV